MFLPDLQTTLKPALRNAFFNRGDTPGIHGMVTVSPDSLSSPAAPLFTVASEANVSCFDRTSRTDFRNSPSL